MFCLWLRKNKYPIGFEVLCANCHSSKHLNGGQCSHQRNLPVDLVDNIPVLGSLNPMDLRDAIIVHGAVEPAHAQVLEVGGPETRLCSNGHTVTINGGIATADGKMKLTASDNSVLCPVCGALVKS